MKDLLKKADDDSKSKESLPPVEDEQSKSLKSLIP